MQRLILIVPSGVAPDALAAALEAGGAAAVVLLPHAGAAGLVEPAQEAGAAVLLARIFAAGDPRPWPLPHGADGLHAGGAFRERAAAVDTRPEGVTIGATASTRHEAMTLGELGSDYVWFGSTEALDEPAVELACWWQALFEVPGVLAGPADDASVARMIATRVEFIAVNVFELSADPADRVARIGAMLREGAVIS